MITTIGRRPIATAKRLMILVHRTDADSEWACDREFNIGMAKQGRSIGPNFFCFQNTRASHILAVMILANGNFYKQKIVYILACNHKNRYHKWHLFLQQNGVYK